MGGVPKPPAASTTRSARWNRLDTLPSDQASGRAVPMTSRSTRDRVMTRAPRWTASSTNRRASHCAFGAPEHAPAAVPQFRRPSSAWASDSPSRRRRRRAGGLWHASRADGRSRPGSRARSRRTPRRGPVRALGDGRPSAGRCRSRRSSSLRHTNRSRAPSPLAYGGRGRGEGDTDQPVGHSASASGTDRPEVEGQGTERAAGLQHRHVERPLELTSGRRASRTAPHDDRAVIVVSPLWSTTA